jgi:hypothetical protein
MSIYQKRRAAPVRKDRHDYPRLPHQGQADYPTISCDVQEWCWPFRVAACDFYRDCPCTASCGGASHCIGCGHNVNCHSEAALADWKSKIPQWENPWGTINIATDGSYIPLGDKRGG